MKFHPILFNTLMIQAQLANQKKETRRLVKFPNDYSGKEVYSNYPFGLKYETKNDTVQRLFPKYEIGDVFWCRETFQIDYPFSKFCYKADGVSNILNKWKPNIFMPKKACRLFQKIIKIKAERLHSITDLDAINEGVLSLNNDWVFKHFPEYAELHKIWKSKNKPGLKPPLGPTPRERFIALWKSINGEESWNENPYVWVYKFKRIEKPLNFI